jgi:hypothetical protein
VTLNELAAALREFAAARDWEQFHTPKNLAMALAGEIGELVLAGIDRRTGGDAYLVVELKQWSRARLYEGNERLVVVDGMHRALEHPLLQVQGSSTTPSHSMGR